MLPRGNSATIYGQWIDKTSVLRPFAFIGVICHSGDKSNLRPNFIWGDTVSSLSCCISLSVYNVGLFPSTQVNITRADLLLYSNASSVNLVFISRPEANATSHTPKQAASVLTAEENEHNQFSINLDGALSSLLAANCKVHNIYKSM